MHGCLTGVAVQRLFQPASAFFVLAQRLGVLLNHLAGTRVKSGGLAKHVELHNRWLLTHSRVLRCARSPRAPAYVKAFREPLTLVMALVALPQVGGVKRTMLPMSGPRAMTASVNCYWVVQVDIRAPFDKGWLVVCGHVT